MIRSLLLLVILFVQVSVFGSEVKISQLLDATENQNYQNAGVAVSPAHLRFSVAPGESKTSKVTINNDTDRPGSFKLSFNDFNMNGYGKSEFLKPGEGDHSLSKWINISPSFVELKPGEKKEVIVTVTIPSDDATANKAAWCVLLVEQAEERKTIDPGSNTDQISFGIIPTFAFGVFIYQNPPNVELNKVEIIDFDFIATEYEKSLSIDVENIGDGITYCNVYVEVTNLKTGESEKVAIKTFTIVPGLKREFNFPLPEKYVAGSYSAVGVLDFGSEEELQAAEIEFQL